MNSYPCVVFFLGCFALIGSPTPAACAADAPAPGRSAESAGTIIGRVQNVVTGQYLNNVRVSMKGTDRVAFTDQSGSYRLVDVPAGSVVLEVFYTGLDPQQITVAVAPGSSVEQDVNLSSVARYGQTTDIVKLDPFAVSSSKETDAAAIAINEQRFAPNIKNVTATDAFGDVMGGNVGEFLKLLPGVFWGDTGQPDVQEVSVRGFASQMTTFSIDGAQLANSPTTSTQRGFQVRQVAINSLSRVEVSKVPMPSTRADSMAGAINMVSKSAFERSRAQLNYGVNLTSNTQYFSLQQTPDAFEKNEWKIFPGFDFDYTLPVNKNFGLVLTGHHSALSNPQDFSTRTYNTAAAGTGATRARPFLATHGFVDAYRYSQRDAMNLKLDWRPKPNSVLSLGLLTGYNRGITGNYSIDYSAGTNPVPVPATGVPFSFGPDFTIGAAGRGTVAMSGPGVAVQNSGAVAGGNLQYRFDDGTWRIEANLAKSISRFWRRSENDGFSVMNLGFRIPIRVEFTGVDDVGPAKIQAFDNNNQPVDLYDANNYVITGASTAQVNTRDEIGSGKLDLRRRLAFLPFPAAVQVGGMRNAQVRDLQASPRTWTYNGPGGNQSGAPYASRIYSGQTLHYDRSGRTMPWISPTLAFEAWQKNPALFSQTATQIYNAVRDRIRNSKRIEETVDAGYFQVEMTLIKHRLTLLTGVRYETTTDDAVGPLQDLGAAFVRNANGTFARNAAGQRIRKPEAGAVGSLEELRLTETDRGFQVSRHFDGYYPSLHLTYNLTENFLARAAYARSYGRPDFADILPTLMANEFDIDTTADPTAARGTIAVTNTGLKPWTANNFDLSLEYYTAQGGLVSVGAFQKQIVDFFGSSAKLATAEDLAELGIDPRYVGWQLTTKFNSGAARISGVEFNFRHSLRALGGWGRYFSAFANGTKLKLEGQNGADFSGFIPSSLNWGFNFNRAPYGFGARWSYLGPNRTAPIAAIGPDAYTYAQFKRPTLDLSVNYQLRANLALYANVKNATREPRLLRRYGSETPEYAKVFRYNNYGALFTVGLKGTY